MASDPTPLPYATSSNSGVVSTVAQEFQGVKTFKSSPIFSQGITLSSGQAIKNSSGKVIIGQTSSTTTHDGALYLYTSGDSDLYHNDKVILTAQNFTSQMQSTLDARYVNVTGDTMSGPLNIITSGTDAYVRANNGSHGMQLRVNANSRGLYDEKTNSFVFYGKSGSNNLYIGADDTNPVYFGSAYADGDPGKYYYFQGGSIVMFEGLAGFTGDYVVLNDDTAFLIGNTMDYGIIATTDDGVYHAAIIVSDATTKVLEVSESATIEALTTGSLVVNGASTLTGVVTAGSHINATGNISSAGTVSAPNITATTKLTSNGTAVIDSTHATQALTVAGGATFGETVVAKKAQIGASGATIAGTTTAQHINPSAHNTYDLGTSSVRWRNIYAQGTVYATTFSGNATSATKFSSERTIALSGDVSGSVKSTGESGWSITTAIGASKVTNTMLAGGIANEKLTNSKIGIAGTDVSLGGSISVEQLLTNLGLTKAMHFVGVATKNPGTNSDPGISGYTWPDDRLGGDVILWGSQEYVWYADSTGSQSRWVLLGDEGSYKVLQSPVSSPSASGNESAFIDTISQNANGDITVTKKNVQISVSAGATDDDIVILTGTAGTNGVSYNAKHASKGPADGYASSNDVTSLHGGALTFKIPQITVDSYGHTTVAADESISLILPKSGAWFNNGFATVNGSGVTEIGRYLDFHSATSSTNNYDVRIDAGTGAAQNTLYLPDISGQFVVHTNNTAVGSDIIPTYVAASGAITASTGTVGSGTKPMWLNAGTLTASASTVGANAQPIYLNSGELTASTADIGASSKPIYMEDGVLKASTSTIGASNKPVFLSSGTITASTSTIGSGINPIFISSGTLTASTSTVGASNKPIYLNEGTLTAFSTAIGGTSQPVYINSSGVITAISDTKGSASLPVYLNGGVITACTKGSLFSDFSSTAGASGETLSITVAGQTRTVTLDAANASQGGVVTTSAQTIAGAKTFTSDITMSGTSAIVSANTGSSYYKARDTALIIHNTHTASSSYSPIYSLKGKSGDFSSGLLHNASGESVMHWIYVEDTNYSTGTNTHTALMNLTSAGTLTAVKFAGNGASLTNLNASNISSGTLSADRLATSGVTAGSYGPSSGVTLTSAGTFTVPYFTVDNKGRVTAASTKTMTVPTIGDATITISAGDGLTTGGSFTTNATSNKTITLAIGAGAGLTVATNSIGHSNSVTAKTAYGSTATTASANGGSITVTDIKYDAQGHITGSTDREITLSQTTYTLSGLGGVGSVSASGTSPLTLSASKSGTAVTITGSMTAASASASGYVTTGAQTLAGNKTFSGVMSITNTTASTSTTTGALKVSGGLGVAGAIYGSTVHNAVWNDYAEYRKAESVEPGRVVIEDISGEMKISTERLQAGASIISDTFGSIMGETEECKTPLAVAGRALAYTYEDRNSYPLGAAVCTGPNGTVSLMTRDEIMMYPERIVGTVSEIPNYETWGTGNVKVNGRIWIKVR